MSRRRAAGEGRPCGRPSARRAPRRRLAVAVAVGLLAAACTDDGGSGEPAPSPPGGATTATAIATGVGVTDAPCPQAVNPDNGCIRLGTLADLHEGPFATFGSAAVQGQAAFWERVNAGGGIAGRFDVDVTRFVRDNRYEGEAHLEAYREIEPRVLALALSFGTPPTVAALADYRADGMVVVPGSWWSGWSLEATDGGLLLESGRSTCLAAMNGLDWHAEDRGTPETVMAVHYADAYGADSAAGVRRWARANDVAFAPSDHDVRTAPNALAGSQDPVVQRILDEQPDVVVLATGPAETGEIVGKVAAHGFSGRFLGTALGYDPALLRSEAAEALGALYVQLAPWAPFGGADTAAHRAMARALDGEPPANGGFAAGWIWSYPLAAVLESAAARGDLTRRGLREALEAGVEVDYAGALPPRSFGGPDPSGPERSSLVLRPDPAAPVGAAVVQERRTGPTAAAATLTAPCGGAP